MNIQLQLDQFVPVTDQAWITILPHQVYAIYDKLKLLENFVLNLPSTPSTDPVKEMIKRNMDWVNPAHQLNTALILESSGVIALLGSALSHTILNDYNRIVREMHNPTTTHFGWLDAVAAKLPGHKVDLVTVSYRHTGCNPLVDDPATEANELETLKRFERAELRLTLTLVDGFQMEAFYIVPAAPYVPDVPPPVEPQTITFNLPPRSEWTKPEELTEAVT